MRLLALLCLAFITGSSLCVAQNCMTIHGRAHYYAGDGQLRIWHIGTHHEFEPDKTTWPRVMKWLEAGVKPSDQKKYAAPASNLDLYADFRVCPSEPYRKGSVQEAKILSATHRRYVTIYPPPTPNEGKPKPASVNVHWNQTVIVSRSTATLQVVVNPMLRRGSPIHDATFAALKALGADYVRYVPWLPYPRLAVAELQPPTKTTTSWDFSVIDPMTLDFLNATQGHSTVMNFSTIPQWMFKTDKPVTYPADPYQVDWSYEHDGIRKKASAKIEIGVG